MSVVDTVFDTDPPSHPLTSPPTTPPPPSSQIQIFLGDQKFSTFFVIPPMVFVIPSIVYEKFRTRQMESANL